MTDITFVTTNENKVREVSDILGLEPKRQNLDLDEIQEMDLLKIIEHKAHQAYAQLKKPVLVEDAGLYLAAWNGFPGPFIKWLATTMGHKTMAESLGEQRGAQWIV